MSEKFVVKDLKADAEYYLKVQSPEGFRLLTVHTSSAEAVGKLMRVLLNFKFE